MPAAALLQMTGGRIFEPVSLYSMLGGELVNASDETFAIGFQLPLSDSVYLDERFSIPRESGSHFHERTIREDNVGRHAFLYRDLPAKSTKLLEQRRIILNGL